MQRGLQPHTSWGCLLQLGHATPSLHHPTLLVQHHRCAHQHWDLHHCYTAAAAAASLVQPQPFIKPTAVPWLLHPYPLCPQVLKTPVSRDMLGRIFNGSGKPIDGG